jgi:ubiquinone/menaquinone biosynthesis C-methylase UbiE
MEASRRTYLPAAGHAWSLPVYDPITTLLGIDSARRTLLGQAVLRPGHRVLDLSCGTGTLVVQLKLHHPEVDVVGVDADPKALARARRKAKRARVPVQFDAGFGDALPYPTGSFDRVLSSFVLHYLETEEKEPTLREIRRVLKVGGTLHLLDFGGDESPRGGVVTGWLTAATACETPSAGRFSACCARLASPRSTGSAKRRSSPGISPSPTTRRSGTPPPARQSKQCPASDPWPTLLSCRLAVFLVPVETTIRFVAFHRPS